MTCNERNEQYRTEREFNIQIIFASLLKRVYSKRKEFAPLLRYKAGWLNCCMFFCLFFLCIWYLFYPIRAFSTSTFESMSYDIIWHYSGVVVSKNSVPSDHLIGKESTLIDETVQRYPLAIIKLSTVHFFKGQTEALCMNDTLCNLVFGNIDGSKLPDTSHFSVGVVTRAQAKQVPDRRPVVQN